MEMYHLTTENFEVFYMDHFDEFLSFVLSRTSDNEIAIDICQECFIKTMQQLQRDGSIAYPRGYFYTLLRNAIIDYYRKKKSLSLDLFTQSGGDIIDTASVAHHDRGYYQQIIKKLDTLPDTYRDIVIMKFVLDLSVAEISERLGLSENVVSVRLHRGRARAQEILSEIYQK